MKRSLSIEGLIVLVLLSQLLACSKSNPPAPAEPAPKMSLRNVMAEVARRFELMGRAGATADGRNSIRQL
jgi:hypothetical protein